MINNPLFDLKPYFRKVSDWDIRLKRLEQKIPCLSPDLIYLSIEIHEMGLNMLIKKLQKFIRIEQLIALKEEQDKIAFEFKAN